MGGDKDLSGSRFPPNALRALFTEIYGAHHQRLFGFVRRIVRSNADAEDLTQEAFTRLYQSLETSPPQHPKAFLYTTARNLAFDLLRSRARRAVYEVTTGEHEPAPLESSLDAHLDLQDVLKIVDRFPARRRTIFIQQRILGLSYKEISTDMNVAISTLEKEVALGLHACRCLA